MKYIAYVITALLLVLAFLGHIDVSWSDVGYQLAVIYFLSFLIVLFVHFFGGKFLGKKK